MGHRLKIKANMLHVCRRIDILMKTIVLTLLSILFYLSQVSAGSSLDGSWNFIPSKSSELPLFSSLSVEIHTNGDINESPTAATASLNITWSAGPSTNDMFSDLFPDLHIGKTDQVWLDCWVFPYNVFEGLWRNISVPASVTTEMTDSELTLGMIYELNGQQGSKPVKEIHTFTLEKDSLMKYSIERNIRANSTVYYFTRESLPLESIWTSQNPYYMKLDDDWKISTNGLGEKLLLLSLQGIVNRNDPMLYFLYPDSWDFTYTEAVFEFYRDFKGYDFTLLSDSKDALKTFYPHVKGLVVFDPQVRPSIMVSLTQAGLDDCLVIAPSWIPYLNTTYPDIKIIADYRGKFTNMSDVEIYNWSYNEFGGKCSKNLTIWLGGVCGDVMQPGIADWGVQRRAFFTDLSTDPKDKDEYNLASKVMAKQENYTMIMGWHSYCKDQEKQFVTLSSKHTLRVEGLNTVPNLSFSSMVPITPGFEFKNHHSIPKPAKPEKKIYISCVQTDGIGLGAWTKPGRGLMPYAWEVTMNDIWMAPAMLEFFYRNATNSDYFIGALGGPGYMYPKPVPSEHDLHSLLQIAFNYMNILDLDVFEIMDYSEMGYNSHGTNNIPKSVAQVYANVMHNVTGLVNGYAPSYTFGTLSPENDPKKNIPLLSFDYYLSPTRSEDDAVTDIIELATHNDIKPYYLLLHVREYSDVGRTKRILDKLGPEFEVVALDTMLYYAGIDPTYSEYFEPE